jgi:ubiquinone/menaquinone biosynthesis C-methylase UbiE
MDNFPKCNIESWDIRSIRYPEDYFDAILDLSTIDHIHPDDVDTVLKEYRRVCKPWWDIVIVVWIWDMEIKGEWKPQDQYFFDYTWFNKKMEWFKVVSKEIIFREWDKELYLYKLKNETINNHPPV